MLEMELLCRRKGRGVKRFLDLVKDDIQLIGMTEEDAEDSVRWKHGKTHATSHSWLPVKGGSAEQDLLQPDQQTTY